MSRDFYTTDNFEPQTSIAFLIKRVQKLGVGLAEKAFADGELSLPQWIALNLVRHELAENSAGLSRCLDHDSGATTRLVDQLEQRGLVERVRSRQDRRVINLGITPEGEGKLAELTPRMIGLWNDVLSDFTHDEATMLIGLLTRLLATLEARDKAAREA
jgi:DNA-binding MarR family transcriptional regulator